jgi:hypothetical protein
VLLARWARYLDKRHREVAEDHRRIEADRLALEEASRGSAKAEALANESEGAARQEAPQPEYVPTAFQERLLRAVKEKALTASNLERKLRVGRRQLYRDGINPLKRVGRLANNRRLGGYYDPTSPPSPRKN